MLSSGVRGKRRTKNTMSTMLPTPEQAAFDNSDERTTFVEKRNAKRGRRLLCPSPPQKTPPKSRIFTAPSSEPTNVLFSHNDNISLLRKQKQRRHSAQPSSNADNGRKFWLGFFVARAFFFFLFEKFQALVERRLRMSNSMQNSSIERCLMAISFCCVRFVCCLIFGRACWRRFCCVKKISFFAAGVFTR
jgi:hypothetical protein